MYDYGARMYMSDIGRWCVIDPMAEKFFDFTGYNYVLNNPIKFVDKDGMDVYLLNEEGKFILAKKQKGDDLVYGYNSKTGKLNDNNGDKKGDYKDGIRIKTKGLVGQLQYYRDGREGDNYPAYHQAIKEYSSQVEDDMFNLFQYAANNAKNVEFSLIDFDKGDKRYLALQTYNDSGFSPLARASRSCPKIKQNLCNSGGFLFLVLRKDIDNHQKLINNCLCKLYKMNKLYFCIRKICILDLQN